MRPRLADRSNSKPIYLKILHNWDRKHFSWIPVNKPPNKICIFIIDLDGISIFTEYQSNETFELWKLITSSHGIGNARGDGMSLRRLRSWACSYFVFYSRIAYWTISTGICWCSSFSIVRQVYCAQRRPFQCSIECRDLYFCKSFHCGY